MMEDCSMHLQVFQPTLPRGERRRRCCSFQKRTTISTHAPARGATPQLLSRCPENGYFNPRSREGSDLAYRNPSNAFKISTHAPARGATAPLKTTNLSIPISTHAPARGATNVKPRHPNRQWNFNPRSREGSDTPYQAVKGCFPYFNPRSREGSDGFFCGFS